MEINKIYNEDCLDTMAKMQNNFIDLTITSPPYDNLRAYNGYSFDFESIAKELYRTTKDGGVVVWIVGDATVKGSETGTSFKQALFFKECGFNLHDTMIWYKTSKFPHHINAKRYKQQFEYMFVFTKGKINTHNPICDIKNKSFGTKVKIKCKIKTKNNGRFNGKTKIVEATEFRMRDNVWMENRGSYKKHPAPFPERLAQDHILSWSNDGDIIYDCFGGSGTTAKMAIINKRSWIISEISNEYCGVIKQRLAETNELLF